MEQFIGFNLSIKDLVDNEIIFDITESDYGYVFVTNSHNIEIVFYKIAPVWIGKDFELTPKEFVLKLLKSKSSNNTINIDNTIMYRGDPILSNDYGQYRFIKQGL